MATDYRQPQDVPAGTTITTGAVGFIRHVSWGALFAGLFVAVATQLTLTLLGIGIGAAAVQPYQQQSPGSFAVGAGIWWLISGLISLFAGGWVAARMSGSVRRFEGALHGLGTWAAAAVFSLLLMTSGVASLVGGSASLVSQYLNSPQTQVQPSELLEQTREALGMEQTGAGAQTAQTQPIQPADVERAASNVAAAGWWGFFGMLLGAAAAVFGGLLGAPKHPAQMAATEERRRAA